MKFLADENFPQPLSLKIRRLGYSVKTIQYKRLQGSADETVANIAIAEKRIVLTFDKDFLKGEKASAQVVVFHFPKVPTPEIIPLIDAFLKNLKEKLSKNKIYKFSKQGLRLYNHSSTEANFSRLEAKRIQDPVNYLG